MVEATRDRSGNIAPSNQGRVVNRTGIESPAAPTLDTDSRPQWPAGRTATEITQPTKEKTMSVANSGNYSRESDTVRAARLPADFGEDYRPAQSAKPVENRRGSMAKRAADHASQQERPGRLQCPSHSGKISPPPCS